METRKENGEKYPPKTLFNLLSGLLCYTCDKKLSDSFNIFNVEDGNFAPLKNVMNSYFKQLHSGHRALGESHVRVN